LRQRVIDKPLVAMGFLQICKRFLFRSTQADATDEPHQRREEQQMVLTDHKSDLPKVRVVNDLFGALACAKSCPIDMPPINKQIG
jgi:hypothetical protein